jgi:hypothetical protein|tara:strand:- start:19681 stop:20478 length:798 start_codon:yes stop_codon:yes gene_type:complete
MEEKFEKFHLTEQVREMFDAHLMVTDFRILKYNSEENRIPLHKREPATRLFHGVTSVETIVDAEIESYFLKRGTRKIAKIEKGEGCDWRYFELGKKYGIAYIMSKGKGDRDVYFENPTVVVSELSEGTYLIDGSQTLVNDDVVTNMKGNRDFRGAGYTWSITGLDRGEHRYGRDYVASKGLSYKGAARSKFILTTNSNLEEQKDVTENADLSGSKYDFLLKESELNDSGNEYLRLKVHTRGGSLLKERLTELVIRLDQLIPEIYE